MVDKKTPVFDWDKMEFKKSLNGSIETAVGNKAVKEVIYKAQQTKRGVYLIYSDPENEEINHKYGSDLLNVLQDNLTGEIRISELKRAVKEAVIYLEGIKDVSKIKIEQNVNDETYIEALVTTKYDDKLPIEGVIYSE